MKKLMLAVAAVSMIGACSTNGDSTLEEMLFGEKSVKTAVPTYRNTPGEDINIVEVDVDVEPEDDEDVIVDIAPGTYQLPTRSERYALYAPLPEIYAIPATRATNKMLDETREFYEQNGDTFLFITDLKKGDRQLPDGIYKAEQTTRKIIEGSKTFKVVGNKDEADYILETAIDNAGTPEEPILVYRMILLDKDNKKINEWVEMVRRVNNDDRSWW